MYTNIDEGKGFVRTCWAEIRSRIKHIEPEFTRLVDKLSPDKSFPLYLTYFPYGAKKGDKDNYLYGADGKVYSLLDDDLPGTVRSELGYGATSTPMGMIIDKVFEYFIPPFPNTAMSYPWRTLTPGEIFPIGRLFRSHSKFSYTPNNLLSVTAGARSAFLLQHVSSMDFHSGLESMARCSLPFPEGYTNHWDLFKALTGLDHTPCQWRACLLYFSEKWINHLYSDPAWMPLKSYLINLFWLRTEYDRAAKFYASAFSMLKKSHRIKSDRYIEQTVRHIFSIALGEEMGFAPAVNDDEIPLFFLKKFFSSHYRLKGKSPTFMVPQHFSYSSLKHMPVYYSMQHTTLRDFSSQTRKMVTAAEELRKIGALLNSFVSYISDNEMFEHTIYKQISETVDFAFYHNLKSSCDGKIVLDSSNIISGDERFSKDHTSSSKFMRGCISISRKEVLDPSESTSFYF